MASSLRTPGAVGGIYNSWLNVAAAQTDAAMVAAVPGRRVLVRAVFANAADAGVVTFTFNTKPAGAGVAISPTFKIPLNGGFVLPESSGWFATEPGEGLAVTTAGASATGLIVVYSYV